jgi:hypothetical protein
MRWCSTHMSRWWVQLPATRPSTWGSWRSEAGRSSIGVTPVMSASLASGQAVNNTAACSLNSSMSRLRWQCVRVQLQHALVRHQGAQLSGPPPWIGLPCKQLRRCLSRLLKQQAVCRKLGHLHPKAGRGKGVHGEALRSVTCASRNAGRASGRGACLP